jgi:signal transduction histidine kinase
MEWKGIKKRLGVELIAIFVMIAVVSTLAVFQYRWTAEISRTEQARLRTSLETSVRDFDQEFSYDFQRLCESFEVDPAQNMPAIESRVLQRYLAWNNANTRPGLVTGVYIWRTDSAPAPRMTSVDETVGRFREVAWPAAFQSLQEFLSRQEVRQRSAVDDREAVYYPWTFYDQAPAMIRPLFQSMSAEENPSLAVRPVGFLIVALSADVLERSYLPDLVDRHFGAMGQKSFVVSIRTANPSIQTVYLSDAKSPMVGSAPDAEVGLFNLVGDEARRRGHAPLQPSAQDRQWQLVVQHPAGSLEEAVSVWRRRNLAISFGLLTVLAGTMILVFYVARRARTLARLQMEFVAGVSHELCTPLAVINAAAENLADGIVDNVDQMQEYGGLIRGQGRRLERLVDEVLLFTAGRFGLSGYDLSPVEVAPVIAQSLVTSEPVMVEAGFKIEKEIAPGLPPVLADPSAMITCIENLMSNAMKYANSERKVVIRALMDSMDSKPEVRISVEDTGIGISGSDIPHIFEPFYRVQAVRDNQIRGVGLGLYLVKRMMEDMGGRVSVSSELGKGTVFALHFPVNAPVKI